MLSDVEFVAVLHDAAALPDAAASEALGRAIELRLAAHNLRTHISADIVHQDYLRNLPPHIYSYELKTCGQVISGDPELLQLIPAFSPSDLSREDAWRMLSNRIIELLALAAERPDAQAPADSLRYATLKLCLDVATSLLVFLGEYEPTYRAREERFRHLSASARATSLPFPVAAFAARLHECTAWKLAQQTHPPESAADGIPLSASEACGPDSQLCFEIMEYARQAWLWELRQLTQQLGSAAETSGKIGLSDTDAISAMVRQLARSQGRLRGWANAIRRRGWLRSASLWPRWLRLATGYSPRYAIYLAAFQLFERLPARMHGNACASQADSALRRILTLLPSCSAGGRELSWEQVIAEVTANYREFVTGTRA
jgi:hypothetical protein